MNKRTKALEKAKGGKKIRPTRPGFPSGAKGGIYGGMHLDEAMRHEERRIKRYKKEGLN